MHSIKHKDARTIRIILGQNTSQAVIREIVWQMSCASKQKMNVKRLFVKVKIKINKLILLIKSHNKTRLG